MEDKKNDKILSLEEVKAAAAKKIASTSEIHKEDEYDIGNKEVKETSINFEKFSKTKKSLKPSKISTNKFLTQMDIWLRNKKSLLIIWSIILAICVIMIALDIYYIITLQPHLSAVKDGGGIWGIHINETISAFVFACLSIAIIPIPFIYLVTTWFVGVNGVISSRNFHVFLWSILAVSFIFFFLANCLGLIPIVGYAIHPIG